MYIGDELQGEKETTKASKVLDIFRTDPNQPVKIETWNNMPTAAGLSSSSSGLSALVKAANELFQVGKTQSELAPDCQVCFRLIITFFLWATGSLG